MKSYLVSFYVQLPDDVPINEIEEFMKFELGEKSWKRKLDSSLQQSCLDDLDIGGVSVDLA